MMLTAFPVQHARAAAITPGNLVVLRVGDGSTTLSSAATAVFLDEYSTTLGTPLVQTIAMPTVVNGTNRILTNSGSAASEGALSRSADGRYLTLAGYDTAPGTSTNVTSTSVNRIVARVDANGNVDTSTRISDGYSSNSIRSATTIDGSGFWTGGAATSAGGTRYVIYGSSGTSTQISSTTNNTRVTGIFGGQLYTTAGTGSNIGLNTVGTGIPTSTGNTTSLFLPVNSSNPFGFIFLDRDPGVAGLDTLYIADQTSANGILKYSFDGTAWTARGALTGIYTGITAVVSGNDAVIYATSGTGAGNKLVTVTDTAAFNANITGTFTTLATAPANTAFRGLAFAPENTAATATPTSTATSTNTPTETATNSPSPTATMSLTNTPTDTETSTEIVPAETETSTPDSTETATETMTATDTPIPTDTVTSTITPTETETNTPDPATTATYTPSPTPAATLTETMTATDTPIPTDTVTNTVTITPTDTMTSTPSQTATDTAIPTDTVTSTVTPTETKTDTPTPTDTMTSIPSQTATDTAIPTDTVTSTVTPTETKTDTPTPTDTMTSTPSQTATDTAIPTDTVTSTVTPTETMTLTATLTATHISTATFTPTETVTSTTTASSTFTTTPSQTPTQTPTLTATVTSTPTSTNTVTKTPTKTRTPTTFTMTFTSMAAQDGWVLESAENSDMGGVMNSKAATFNIGDDASRRQYRSILSFNTGNIPSNATITGMTLNVKKQAIIGTGNPITIFGGFMADIKNNAFGITTLQATDFQTAGTVTYGPFSVSPFNNIYSLHLTTGKLKLNPLTALTQIRLRFKLDDNNNTTANYLSLYSGNTTVAADRPQLVVTYTVP